MAEIRIMKAVEHSKLSAGFKKRYPDLYSMELGGWWIQPKYDGCFGMAVISSSGSRMLSRTGEDYTKSCGHILEELKSAADWQSGSWDDFVVLGEVWHPMWDFPKISGKFRKQAACEELVFIANDLLPPELATVRPYLNRYEDLKHLLPPARGDRSVRCTVTDNTRRGWTDALAYALNLKKVGGFDGAILRDPTAPYRIGLVKNGELVKVKPVLSLDLKVSNEFLRYGEKTGRLVIVLEVDYRGVKTEVGSGIPHRLKLGDCMGKIVEVECMGVTENGKLREPRVKGIRYDKEFPDG